MYAAETAAANALGCDCRNHRPWGGFCPRTDQGWQRRRLAGVTTGRAYGA